jgi:hypothetical protein
LYGVLHSDDRILTTHVGALPRSAELEQKVQAHRLDESVPIDGLREEVAQSVRDQVAAGVWAAGSTRSSSGPSCARWPRGRSSRRSASGGRRWEDARDMGPLWAQIVLTLVTLGYSLVPARADLNPTHATNPLWTGHARYHVVCQVGSYVGVALVALFLIWVPGPFTLARLLLAACLAGAAYGGFFVAMASMPRYAGRLADENGCRRSCWVGCAWT